MSNELSQFYSGKRVLITGASGYIASCLLNFFSGLDMTIIRLSRKDMSPLSAEADVVDYTGDLGDTRLWRTALNQSDVVFHLASQTSVYKAEDDPIWDWECNVLPMLTLLEVCKTEGYRPGIVFTGTATQVGMTSIPPVDEEWVDQPITAYDFHKLTAEGYLKLYTRHGIVKGTSLRLPNIYGPGPASSSRDRGIVNMMIRKAIQGEDLTVYGEGSAIRDYLYIHDLRDALLSAGANFGESNGRHFLLGTGVGTSIRDMIQLIATQVSSVTGTRVRVKFLTPPAGLSRIEDRNYVADPSKSFKALGWRAKVSIQEGIEKTIEQFLQARST